MAKIVLDHVPKGGDVFFENTRVTYGRVAPWVRAGYKDRYGSTILFKEIPLCEEQNGKLVQMEKTNPITGNVVSVTWDQKLSFLGGERVLGPLHPVTHYLVIQAIRDWNGCASSKKSEGLRKVTRAMVREREPDVIRQEEFNALESLEDAMALLRNLKKGSDHMIDYVFANYRLTTGGFQTKYNHLNNLIQKNPEAFLGDFKTVNGVVNVDKPELKPDNMNKAIVRLALEKKVIEYVGGVYYFGDAAMGNTLESIHKNHPDIIGKLKSEIFPSKPKAKKEVANV